MTVAAPGRPARTRRALLSWGLCVAAVLVAVGASGRAAGAQDAPARDAPGQGVTASGPERGALLYAQYCAECHGPGGRGAEVPEYGGEAPPLVPEANENISVAYLDLVMSTGRMPPAGSPYDNRARRVVFDAEERADIIAWMVQEFDVPGEIPEAGEGNAARGQEVWATNCAHCHGATGQGGVAGAGAWTPPVVDRTAVEIAEAIRVGPFQMPQFDRDQISDSEVADVVAFMEAVEEEPATPVLGLVELNPVYASGFVIALTVLLLASLVWIGGKPAWFPDPERPAQPEVPAGARRRGATASTGAEQETAP